MSEFHRKHIGNNKKNEDMKKIFMAVILTAIAIGAACTDISAKKSDDSSRIIALMQKYDDENGVEAMNINGFLLGIAKAAAKNEEGSEWIKYLDRMAIFSAEEAEAGLKEKFMNELYPILESYEKIMEMKDEEDSMSIWLKMKDEETISEMVIVADSDASVIMMCGKIPLSEMGKIVADQQ